MATKTLSSLYLAVSKDTLYAGSETDRQPVLFVLQHALDTITSVLAPILPHLAEEIAWYRQGATADPTPDEQQVMPSVFQRGWRAVDDAWHDPALERDMQQVLRVRSEVFGLMTHCIEQQHIRSAAETDVDVWIDPSHALYARLTDPTLLSPSALATLLGVAHATVHVTGQAVPLPDGVWAHERAVSGLPVYLRMRACTTYKCPRCWQFHSTEADTLCARCTAVLTP